jgi:glycosyltransferase involved in cell wall biosynthesis
VTSIKAVSLVIPVFNEQDNIPILADEIDAVMSSLQMDWECIWVDDCSSDASWNELKKLNANHRALKLARNSGQSTALMAGIDKSSHDVIITLDSDLQNDPADIPALIAALTEDKDVVCGYRSNRQDGLFLRKIPSKIANFIARKMTKIPVRDLGCTLRIFRKSLLGQNRLLGEMHRVLVIHFANSGAVITEIPTHHRARIHGNSKYGLERTFKFIADLFLARVMRTMMAKPLYFFGLLSFGLFVISIMFGALAIILRVTGVKNYIDSSLVVGAFLMMATSTIVISLGLIAEMLLRNLVQTDRIFQYAIQEQYNVENF